MPPVRPSPPLPYSKDDKGRKPRPFAPPPSPPRRIWILILLSAVCLLFGAGGIGFAAVTLRRPPRTVTVFRCGGAEDTLRTFRSRSLGATDGGLIGRPKLLGFVGVQTGFSSADRRAALRSTWFPPDPDGLVGLEHATGLAFRFVLGWTKDAKKMADLKKEKEKYHDFMFIDVEEEYINLPHKTLAFFKAAFNLFDAEFYVKADDDIYLRPDRLATLLAKDRGHRLTYIGCMKKGPVITDPKMKWFESSGHLIGNEYFLHAYGPIYALSAKVVEVLATVRNDSLRMFNNEDVTVGSWMLAMNVTHEDNRAICDTKCTPTSIAVWDMPRCSGSPIVAELWAVKNAMEEILSRNISNVTIFTDAKLVRDALVLNTGGSTESCQVIRQCMQAWHGLVNVTVQWIPRAANGATHWLAREVQVNDRVGVWHGGFPPMLSALVAEDWKVIM